MGMEVKFIKDHFNQLRCEAAGPGDPAIYPLRLEATRLRPNQGRSFTAATTAPSFWPFAPQKTSSPAYPTRTCSALYYRYFAIFSCASLLSLRYLDTSVCCWDFDLLFIKCC